MNGPVPWQTGDVLTVKPPGVAGSKDIVIACVDAVDVPQLLLAVTLSVPDVAVLE